MMNPDLPCDVCGDCPSSPRDYTDDVCIWLCAACQTALKPTPKRTSPWMIAAVSSWMIAAVSWALVSYPLALRLLEPEPVDRELLQIIGFGLCSDAIDAADYLAKETTRPTECNGCEWSWSYFRWSGSLGGNLVVNLCDSEGRAEARARAFWKNGDGWRDRPPRLHIGTYWEPGGWSE